MQKPVCVLTIAGSDSGAGAGIQADARTIHALGGYAVTAITAVTAQNTRGVAAWRAVPSALIAAQIKAVLDDFSVAAVKTGLLPGTAAVRAIGRELARHPRLPLVVDPVIGSTSGVKFLPAAALRTLKQELLPRATLVTPNWPEAAVLTGGRVQTHEDAEAAARQLAEACGCAVLVTGLVRWFESPRIKTHNTHGTGCVLSAAIATNLANGEKLESAVARAHEFLWRSLRAGRETRWGRGHGPAFAG
jgi:hydroxymethylpyrimidine/phosphomethylpyrimidine kinase